MYQRKNFAYTTVATAPSPAASGTTLVCASGEGARFPNTSGGTYVCVIKAAGVPANPDNAEVVLVTSHDPANDNFTITRTQESSNARTVVVGDEFYLSPTDGVWDQIDVLTTKGDLLTFSTVYARLGVGTNGYGLVADSGETTGLKWIDLASRTETQTNKRFTSPKLNEDVAISATATEVNLIDGSVAGTAVASKALVLGADKNVDTLSIADGGLKLGAGAGTAVTSTAAELNALDGQTGAWTSFNPTIANLNVGSTGTLVGAYCQIGKTVHWRIKFVLGGTGISVGAISLTLPVSASSGYGAYTDGLGHGSVFDGATSYHLSITGNGIIFAYNASGTYTTISGCSSTVPLTWAAGHYCVMSGTYEAA